ncbi:TerD family protein [Streptomyces albireticuli]|uniref:Resistance protein n=1 Tax=Streptomyces albireticuli TaxID=1940 RepID=A0A2A2D3P1_9ACTN|nr:TerD family protein [Streptomyces albireticuli]MCD9141704.1 TerD family protein [Streptomyces albireticuli]MCD9165932.1 TerD family protein [Streptomyces albireticuli]MCD9189878.1 TerD family protein [Streptomyces albireticuli]PAU46077.1 resistance protein [Streptomyces albireticuli]
MTRIAKGANLPVPVELLHIAVSWRADAGVPDVDLSALLLDATGKVRGDADLVFYNQPAHPSGAVRHLGKSDGAGGVRADWLTLDPAVVEPGVERIVVSASADGGAFGRVPDLDIRVATAAGAAVAHFPVGDATTETAFVFGEFYRRAGGWKFRAVGQGYASGLAGLATDFGIVVDGDEPRDAAPQPPVPPVPAAPQHLPTFAPPVAEVPRFPTFAPVVRHGRGNETVTFDRTLPPGRVLLQMETRDNISVTVSDCDAYGRTDNSLLFYYADAPLRGRTVAEVPADRPLTLRIEAERAWTLAVLPVDAARQLTTAPVEGRGPDVLVHHGAEGVGSFAHRGEHNFTVEHLPHDPEGWDDLLVNEIGRIEVGAPLPGPGLLKIEADGPWTCALRR